MGWYGDWETRKELAEYLTGSSGPMKDKTLARKFSGNTLWAVQLDNGDKPFLTAYLMSGDRKGYCYKPVSEEMGPTDTSCPIKFLDMVPDPGGYATAWRARVLALAAERGSKRPRLGEVWSLRGTKPSVFRITSLKPLNGTAADWLIWRLPRARLDECLFKPAWASPDVMDLVGAMRRSRSRDALPVLADALMEAGCSSSLPDLLRAPKEDGSYSVFEVLERACWHLERTTAVA